jgi:excisionase family DNA binding protein
MIRVDFPLPSGRLLPTNVVASRLHKSRRTVRWYATTGQLRAVRVGIKLWKFYESDVEVFKRHFYHDRAEAA